MAGKKKTKSDAPVEGQELTEEQQFDIEAKETFKTQTAATILGFQKTLRCYSSGCTPLDMAAYCIDPETGLPGFRARDKAEFYGPYGSLKTVLLENFAIDMLRKHDDGRVVMVLSEEGDIERLASRGADVDRIHVLGYYDEDVDQCYRNYESVLAAAASLVKNPKVKGLLCDGWAAGIMKSDVEDKEGEQIDYAKAGKVGALATLTQRFLKDFRLNNKCAFLGIANQIRDFIPASRFNMFEDKMRQRTPGGNAFRHEMDWRIECYSKKHEAEKDHPYLKRKVGEGLDFFFRMVKQKVPRKYADKVGQNTFWFDPPGFDAIEGIMPFAEFFGMIQRSGTAHYIVNEQKFHGKEQLFHYLESNPEYMEHLLREVVRLNKDESYYSGVPRPSAKLV